MQKALNNYNFDVVEKMFSDNMWEKDPQFMNDMHNFTELRRI